MTEAAQCHAQSTMILPVFLDSARALVVAALEVVQTAEDLPFAFVLASFAEILPVRGAADPKQRIRAAQLPVPAASRRRRAAARVSPAGV